MNKAETLAILATIKLAYPNFAEKFSQEEKTALANLWLKSFKDNNPKTVQKALDTFIQNDTSGFAPTIGQLQDSVNIYSKHCYQNNVTVKNNALIEQGGNVHRLEDFTDITSGDESVPEYVPCKKCSEMNYIKPVDGIDIIHCHKCHTPIQQYTTFPKPHTFTVVCNCRHNLNKYEKGKLPC